MNIVDTTPAERNLAERIDQGVTGRLAVSDRAGGIAFVNMSEVMEMAKLMAVSSIAIPKHLRGNAGACLAICIQALEWQMSPYSVANKSYSVNDRLAYEAQLIEAVILRRAPIKGRPKIEYKGDGERRVCRVSAELRDEPGEIVEYTSPPFGQITPKNSPLWKADPDQQQFYYSARAFCRRHFPDVLLGVYARDELDDSEPFVAAVGVTPDAGRRQPRNALAALDRFAGNGGDEVQAPPDNPDADDDAGDRGPGDDVVIESGPAPPAAIIAAMLAQAEATPPQTAGEVEQLVTALLEHAGSEPDGLARIKTWWTSPATRALRNRANITVDESAAIAARIKRAIEAGAGGAA